MDNVNKSLRERNIGIIKSAERHLKKSKGNTNLYYIPPYEKALIKTGLNDLRNIFYNHNENDSISLNERIGDSIQNIVNQDKKEYLNPLNQILIEGTLSNISESDGYFNGFLNTERNRMVEDTVVKTDVSFKVSGNIKLIESFGNEIGKVIIIGHLESVNGSPVIFIDNINRKRKNTNDGD